MGKAEQVVSENPGVSLDDLVAQKKLNNDQRAQLVKKPALEAQIKQYQEQLDTYKQIDQEYTELHAKEKELLQSSHASELQQMKETVIAEQRLLMVKEFRIKLLTLSRYLSAAAKRRNGMADDEEETQETKAFEGLLAQVYGANPEAVYAAEKLIDGAEEPVPGQDGVLTNITYATIKKLSLEDCPIEAEDPFSTSLPIHPTAITSSSTDPTVANAGLTEIQSTAEINGTSLDTTTELDTTAAPPATNIDDGAANAAGEEQWDTSAGATNDPMSESFEMIPRDPAEVETPTEPINTAAASQSWADDTPIEPSMADVPSTTAASDEFTAVPTRGRGRGFRGGPGEGRGRGGFRGEFRGRGRGGPRGEGRGDFRGDFRGGRGRGPRGDGFRGGFRGGRGGQGQGQAPPPASGDGA